MSVRRALLNRLFLQSSATKLSSVIPSTWVLSKHCFASKGPKGRSPAKNVLTISDLNKQEICDLLRMSSVLKQSPLSSYNKTLENRTVLMLFEKVSLRTRMSFEVGMGHLGGHGIFYDISHSPLGQKETFSDTARVLSRYCDAIMARVKERSHVQELAKYATIPVINGLDDFAHPTQMLADLLTIKEAKQANFSDLKFMYIGDVHNNVTYDLMRACALMGFKECVVCGPLSKGREYNIEAGVLEECAAINNGCNLVVTEDVEKAALDADVIYTDSWMSYGILPELQEQRIKIFEPLRVTAELMRLAKNDCIFMNCLPAMRGQEQTAEVIDGPQSVVFDQAENRMHTIKALLLYLINGNFKNNTGDSSEFDNFKF